MRPVLRSLAPASATVVVLMGLANRAAICERACSRPDGRRKRPAAVLIGSPTRERQSWHGALDAIHSAAIDDQENLPGIIVVGAVAALAGNHRGAGARAEHRSAHPLRCG